MLLLGVQLERVRAAAARAGELADMVPELVSAIGDQMESLVSMIEARSGVREPAAGDAQELVIYLLEVASALEAMTQQLSAALRSVGAIVPDAPTN